MKVKLKKIAINFSLMIFIFIILLVLGEIGANVMIKLGKGQRHQVMGEADNIVMTSLNKDLEFVFKPHYVDANGDTITNSFGFHELDWQPSELDRSKVILNLGDSIAFGANIKDINHVYGKILQMMLQQKFPDENYIVYNAGVGGYNIWQERAMLQELTGKIKYDMVLLGLCLNDSSPKMYVSDDVKGAVVNVTGELESAKEIFSRKFFNRSKLYVMFKEALKSMQRRYPKLFPSSMLWHNVLVNGEGWHSLKNTLLDMHESLSEKGIPFVIVIFPYAHQLQLDATDNIVQNDLLNFCQDHDVPCLDLFSFYKDNSQSIHWDQEGIHPDESGHRVAGESIFNYLIEQKLIPIKDTEEVRYE
ncbi:MAG: SGNH/GDSL hydrolase family protein [bacterium]|nr:SGNH/GDSL hydrolase family protein [bacterium]